MKRLYPGGARQMLECNALRAALLEWGVKSLLTNMHVERLLSQVRAASPENAPSIERVCTAGLMTQFLTEHVRLGRTDPRFDCASDLVRKGAPLQLAVGRSARNKRMARSGILYANEQVAKRKHEVQAEGADGHLRQAEVHTILRRASREFRDLPEREQLAFRARVKRNMLFAEAECQGDGVDQPADMCRGFFGCGSEEFPFSLTSAKDTLLDFLALPADTKEQDLPGFTSYSSRLREDMEAKLFVPDEGDIPTAQKFVYSNTCWLKYYGLCESRDALGLRNLRRLADSIHAHAEETGWYKIRSVREDGEDIFAFFFTWPSSAAGPPRWLWSQKQSSSLLHPALPFNVTTACSPSRRWPCLARRCWATVRGATQASRLGKYGWSMWRRRTCWRGCCRLISQATGMQSRYFGRQSVPSRRKQPAAPTMCAR